MATYLVDCRLQHINPSKGDTPPNVALYQIRNPDNFATVTWEQLKAYLVSKRIGAGKTLGGQPAFRASNRLIENKNLSWFAGSDRALELFDGFAPDAPAQPETDDDQPRGPSL